MVEKIKIILLLLLLYRMWQYHRGFFAGVVAHKLLIDWTYCVLGAYILFKFSTWDKIVPLDLILALLVAVYTVQLLLASKVYLVTGSLGRDAKPRLLYVANQLIAKGKWDKCYRLLTSHIHLVVNSPFLMFCLGEAYEKRGHYSQAIEYFEQVCELSDKEDVVLHAAEKVYHIYCLYMKDKETALHFIAIVQKRDFSSDFVSSLDRLLQSKS